MKMLRPAAKEKLTLAAAGGCALVMYLALAAALRLWPFGDHTLLTGDLNSQYIAFFAWLRSALLNGEDISYAVGKALGGSMMGILLYYCAGPLNWLFLLVEPLQYDVVVTVLFGAKIVLGSVLMAFYLGRRVDGLGWKACPLGVAYGFCAYMMVYAQHIMWQDVVMLAPLVCYGVWKLANGGKPFCFALTLGFAIFSNFYIAFMLCIFSVFYFLFELFLALPSNGARLRFAAGRCGCFAGAAALAGGMACVLLLPCVGEILTAKQAGSDIPFTGGWDFDLRGFWEHLAPGSFEWQYDILDLGNFAGHPNVYCGVLCVAGVLLFFAAKDVSAKEKLAAGAVLAVLFLSMYSTDFMVIWHGLKNPNWFYWRNSFLVSFWAILLTAFALAKGRFTWPRLAVCGGILVVWLALCRPQVPAMFTPKRWLLTAALCAAYLAVVALTPRLPRAWLKNAAALGMATLLMAELLVNGYWTLRQFEQYPRSGYQEFVTENGGAAALAQQSDPGAYRIESLCIRAYNDPLLLGYNGVAHFSSTQEDNSYALLGSLTASSMIYSDQNTLFADSFLGIRYVMAKEDGMQPPAGYEKTELACGDTALYKNAYALPIAMAVTDAMREVSLKEWEGNTVGLQNAIWRAATGLDTSVVKKGGKTDKEQLAQWAEAAHAAVETDTLTQASYTAQLTLEKDSLVLLTIPYRPSLVITVDGEPAAVEPLLDGTLCGVVLKAGAHTLHVSNAPPMVGTGIAVTACSLLALAAWALWWKKKKQV